MQKPLDKLAIKLCESLPLAFTIYEKDGFCRRPNENCDYCRKNVDKLYFCNKKTYTSNQELRFA
jgi:hypothetical protein